MGSSSKPGTKILGVLSHADAERLLLEWANLHDVPYPGEMNDECRRLILRNSKVFDLQQEDDPYAITGSDLMDFRDILRRAWDAPNQRSRDWHCFRIRAKFHEWKTQIGFNREFPPKHVDDVNERDIAISEQFWWKKLEDPPPVAEFEAAVFYLQTSVADRAKLCGSPNCPSPYFIAAKRWQKYCSEACAGPANREAKRRWWHEHKGEL